MLTGPGTGVRFSFLREKTREHRLRISRKKRRLVDHSRRDFLLRCGQGASLAFLPAGLDWACFPSLSSEKSPYPSNEFHVHPHYRMPRGLDAVLQKANAQFDDFDTEKYHDQVAAILSEWSSQLLESPQKTAAMEKAMASNFSGASPKPTSSQPVRAGSTLQTFRMEFSDEALLGREAFLGEWRSVMNTFSTMVTAEFQVTSIRVEDSPPLANRLGIPLK